MRILLYFFSIVVLFALLIGRFRFSSRRHHSLDMLCLVSHESLQVCQEAVPMLIIVAIIIIALIVRDFLQSPHYAANCGQHVHTSGPDTIIFKSCATHQALITCKIQCARCYEGTAQLLSLTEFKPHFFYFSFIFIC